ncbi:endonuclease/exonuclease/phosphatase family protein [Primorskyibacter aestuariivivens]|uniref:endonuclease/exonuclease/phosphatase family protein n=1 Tax=Primorskyibacter aestuariivivens TaxID=1888912 RepID=UPI0023015EE6|nr:endonuclease/exonuclease/phosphatase family protein [Primorskyibacter aestuariivivens]MDA7427022.1 endonuclease/exonuclease/phosphatase family protein [Primorskyibacter aestuariivivens]
MRVLVIGVSGMLGLLIGLGYLGALHPAGDSLAVFRLPLVIVFALVVIWAPWPRRLRWPLAGLAMAVMAPQALDRLFPPGLPDDGGLVLYHQNLRFNRGGHDEWLELVNGTAPDLITLQEVSGRNRSILARFADTHPHQHYCDFATVGGVAVLSRFPAIEDQRLCAEGDGLAAMQVATPEGPVWIVSLHLHWPWPYRQAAQLDRLIPVLEALDGPVLIGGDFNAMAWSHALRRVARATDTTRARSAAATFTLPRIGLPVTIDHMLAPRAWAHAVRTMPRAGSDHNGLVLKVRPGDAPKRSVFFSAGRVARRKGTAHF